MRMKRYLGRMIWVGTAPLIGLAGAMSAHHLLTERALLEQSAEILAGQLAESLDEDIGRRIAGLRMLAGSPMVEDPRQIDALHRLARDYVASFGSHVALFDAEFSHLMNTRVEPGQPLPAITLARGRSAVTLARESGQPQVGDVVRTRWSPDSMVGVAVPAVKDGAVRHLFVTTFETRQIQRRLDAVPIPQGWRVRVLDSLGQEIARLGPAVELASTPPALHLVRDAGQTPWRVEVDVLRSAYWGPLLSTGAMLLAGLLVTTGVALGVARRAGSRLNGEIEALATQGTATAAAPTIEEISHVYRRLLDSATARDRAVAARREDEVRFLAELENRRRILDTALASMNDAVWIGDAQGRTLAANDALVSIHRLGQQPSNGEPAQAWASQLVWSGTSGEELPDTRWPMALALQGETASSAQYLLTNRATGERWYGSYSFAPIRDSHGQVQGAVVMGRDITPLRRIREELQASRIQLRRLLASQHQVEERERRRIALELHDDLQQKLAALRIELSTLEATAGPRGEVLDHPGSTALDILDSALEATRRIVNDLRPAALDQLGLVAALEAMVSQLGDRHGLGFEVEVLGAPYGDITLPPDQATCLYRVAQEALNNVIKHAQASSVRVVVDMTRPGSVGLRIEDNGVGLDGSPSQSRATGLGIVGMRERLAAFGGTVDVASAPGGGTQVTAEMPR